MVARIYSGTEGTRSLKTAEGGCPWLGDGCSCPICCVEEDWGLADEIGRLGADGGGHGHPRMRPLQEDTRDTASETGLCRQTPRASEGPLGCRTTLGWPSPCHTDR